MASKKKQIFKLFIFVLIMACISIGVYFILKAFGLTDVEVLGNWLESFGLWSILIYILLRIIMTIFCQFVPACSMMFDLLALAVFKYLNKLEIFLVCYISIILTSYILELIGRFGGSKAAIKLVGEDDYNNALSLVQRKGMVYLPVMYLLPVFPDDAICMVAGATKIKFWVHAVEIALCRGIGCATIIFGIEIIPDNVSNFTSTNPLDYIKVIVVIIAGLALILLLTKEIDKILTKKLTKNK